MTEALVSEIPEEKKDTPMPGGGGGMGGLKVVGGRESLSAVTVRRSPVDGHIDSQSRVTARHRS